jgi:hypothetical protein
MNTNYYDLAIIDIGILLTHEEINYFLTVGSH